MLTKKDNVILESKINALAVSFAKLKRSRGVAKEAYFKQVKSMSRGIYTFMHKLETEDGDK